MSIEEDDQQIDEVFLRNDAFTLQRSVYNEKYIENYVSRCPSEGVVDARLYYCVTYRDCEKTGRKTRIISKIIGGTFKDVWGEDLDDSTNVFEMGLLHYNKLRRLFKKAFIEVRKGGPFPKPVEEDTVTLEMLKNLDSLEIDYNRNAGRHDPISITTQRWIHDHYSRFGLLKRDILNYFKSPAEIAVPVQRKNEDVRRFLYMPFCGLKQDEFWRLRAKRVYMKVEKATAENIVDFVRAWELGKVRKQFEWCIWNTMRTIFDKDELMKVLNGGVETSEPIVLQHQKTGQIARFYCTKTEIRFFCDKIPEIPEEKPVKKVKLDVAQLSQNIRKVLKNIFKSPLTEKSEKLKLSH